jgi:hypothetical protein
MAGQGGYKHRKRAARGRVNQRAKKARANIARVQNQFEAKGQTWDPANNSAQMAALNHDARRHVMRSPVNAR